MVQNTFEVIFLETNTKWEQFVNTGKIADYLEYRQACSKIYTTVGDLSNDADKNRWNSDKTTENQRK